MKKYIILVLSVMMLLAFTGCKKNNDPKPNPTPKPDPAPVVTKFTSRLGNINDIEKAMQDFKDKTEWTFFFEGINDEDGTYVYGVWDDDRVYQGNYADYIKHGTLPMIDLTVAYNEDGTIWGYAFYVPFTPIDEVPEKNYENIVLAEKMILKAGLPELSDSDIEKLIDKLSLVTVDALEAYAKHQADPSEFTETNMDIYLTAASETAEYNISVEYDKNYKTMLVALLPKGE